MTKQEYIDKSNELKAQLASIEKKFQEVRNEYLSTSEFKEGDKVLVTLSDNQGRVVAFISEAKIGWTYDIEYDFNKCKKDGTRGMVSAGIWQYSKIEKYNEQ